MAGQRCGESGRHRARGRARGRALVLLSALILGACSGDATGPGTDRPGSFGGGTSAGAGGEASLVGVWRNVSVVQVPGDLQTWTTTWQFDEGGTCRKTVVTESLAEGFPRTSERSCTWTVSGSEVTIAFLGAGTLTFEFSFAGFSPDRLVLDGFEYQRLA